ncbi:serine hydrolase domain-containing protein [Roseivirga sp.]|uniref:serine hydrolase domain-containing protein n=1 Tax=Roseivirga sp. TaxID=1964215 RepID=UPI003B8B81A6
MRQLFFLLLFTCYGTIGLAQASYTYEKPNMLDDGWIVNSLEERNVNASLFEQFINALNKEKHELHSILLVKDNELLFEKYFGDNSVNKQHDLRSVTKSITALLMGIAIEKGFVKSVDDPVAKYLEEFGKAKNPDARKDQITIRNFLTMSSGMECNDWNPKSKGQEDKLYKKKDWIQFMANLPMANEPGEASTYCTGGTILIAEIIERSSGLALSEFAQKHLFDTMGIENLSWGHTNKKPVISAGERLYMTSRDMAKLGQLMLNKGNWQGEQLIPKEWIKEIASPKTKITGLDYSYLWWQLPFSKNDEKVPTICATGNGGQYILTFPKQKTVAIFTGGAYNSPNDKLPFTIVNKIILPSINDN